MTQSNRSLMDLQERFRALPAPPTDRGRLVLMVRRDAPGVHGAVVQARLTPEDGIPGDEWRRRTPINPDAQMAVIRRDVAELIGAGQPLTTSGDNLVVDLDLSTGNLPVGTTLRVGQAVVEVTPKPHNGCGKFAEHFGEAALQFVNAPATRHLNLRGVYWRVLEAGDVTVGAAIDVISRPSVRD
jgi:MOSC domain-containing protein YiiM